MRLTQVVLALLLIAPQLAVANTIRLTVYDDGLACPAGCDAHVVFHPSLNGTEFAHAPSTPSAPFAPCTRGQTCRLCLESGGRQCLEATYRGTGPGRDTFDFTPRFYETACAGMPEQPLLAQKCETLRAAARRLDGRVNCIAQPSAPLCVTMMKSATRARTEDRVEYERCLELGESRYNAEQPPQRQRALRCAYEREGTGGPNSNGLTWRRLLPGACRDGTFVGRDGLDCCRGIALADGPLGRECRGYYPQPSGG